MSVQKQEDLKVFSDIEDNFSFSTINNLFLPKISSKDIVIFSRQIATLFTSGISSLRAFRLIAAETESVRLKAILIKIGDDMQNGSSISASLERYSHIFGSLYANLIKVGEETGKISESFSYLADYMDRNYELAQKIKKASTYPLFVVCVFIIVMTLMIVYIIPNIANALFEDKNNLPLITKLVLGVGNIIRAYGIFVLVFLAGVFLYVRSIIKTESGKSYVDYFKLKIPVFNSLYKKIFLTRITDNLDTMFSSGVQIIKALEITSNTVDNTVFRDIINRVSRRVKNGKSLSDAFGEEEELPSILVQMTKIGEETGNLGYILKTLSSYYKREVASAIDLAIALIEPAMIVCLAVGVGILMAAVLLPMFSVVNTI